MFGDESKTSYIIDIIIIDFDEINHVLGQAYI